MDDLFKALNDPVRRALLDLLRETDGRTLSELEAALAARGVEMTRFGVMKHLKTLEAANLVVPRKAGRFKHHHLNPIPLQEMVDRWVEPFLAAPLARSILNLKAHLEGDTTMSETPDLVLHTFIRTSQDALWDALTAPGSLAAHHFAASRAEATESGGHRVLRADGSVMLTQEILSAEPKTRLEMTFEPNWLEGENLPSRIVLSIAVEGEICKLTCEHYGIPAGQDGVREGWARYLASLKSWLETGAPIKLSA